MKVKSVRKYPESDITHQMELGTDTATVPCAWLVSAHWSDRTDDDDDDIMRPDGLSCSNQQQV